MIKKNEPKIKKRIYTLIKFQFPVLKRIFLGKKGKPTTQPGKFLDQLFIFLFYLIYLFILFILFYFILFYYFFYADARLDY